MVRGRTLRKRLRTTSISATSPCHHVRGDALLETARRERACTAAPASTRRWHRWVPIKPLAPVTRTACPEKPIDVVIGTLSSILVPKAGPDREERPPRP